MPLTADEVIDSRGAVAYVTAKDKNDKINYLGDTLFPNQYKETSEVEVLSKDKVKVTPLKLSALDAKPTLRLREKFSLDKVTAPFFREVMVVSEKDEELLQNIESTKSPIVADIVRGIYDDVSKLKRAADINPEIMRFQLLFPKTGGPNIEIEGVDNTYFKFDYDPDGKWAATNRKDLSGVQLWTNPKTADPVKDINDLKEADSTDADLKYLILNKNTLKCIAECESIRKLVVQKAVDPTITYVTNDIAIDILKTYCDLDGVMVYNKKVYDEAGNKIPLVPDGYVGLCERPKIGTTWRTPTPEERSGRRMAGADVSIIGGTRVAVTKITSTQIPIVTETYVSEACLPTFDNMSNYYLMFVGAPGTTDTQLKLLTVTSEEGTASGTSKFTVSNMADSTNTLRIKAYADGTAPEVPNYLDYSYNWKDSSAYTSGEDFTVASGTTVEIRELNADGRCVAYVVVTAVSKA